MAHCWLEKCQNASPDTSDCFTGDPICQHGDPECALNAMEACGLAAIEDQMATAAFSADFMICFEANAELPSHDPVAALEACANTLPESVDPITIKACAADPAARSKAMLPHAVATVRIGRARPGVPYILVNGAEVDASDLVKAVCSHMSYPKPPGCTQALPPRRLVGPSTQTPLVISPELCPL
mmetsp:Transcript_27948/g.91433  ORF Transcript_27948/g.91433 Transcript_27948/m.91433 type:complete len:184 (-) Transcript_27948:78-629(-)